MLRQTYRAVAIVFCLLAPATTFAQSGGTTAQRPKNIYVSEFVSRTLKDPALLSSFTELFETALINSGAYRVLNRRNLQKVLAESQSEYVASMGDVKSPVRGQIAKIEGAQGVVFGEVVDDSDSGDVRITVSLESFDSLVHWKHSGLMKRGLLRDGPSRQRAMERLMQDISAEIAIELGTGKRLPEVSILQDDGLKVTLSRLSLTSGNRHAALTVVLENTTQGPLPLALDNNGQLGTFAGAKVRLSDDRGTTWYSERAMGLPMAPCCYTSLSQVGEEHFTTLAAGQRVAVSLDFNDDNNGVGTYRPYNAPGSYAPAGPKVFEFSAGVLYLTATGARRLAISLTGIRPR